MKNTWLLGLIGAGAIRVLGASWRTRLSGIDRLGHEIYAISHGQLLLAIYRARRDRPVAMISRHSDGEIIAQAVERLGYSTVRGSSTRGAAAATGGFLRGEHDSRPWVVTPDGPKGPRGSVKSGLIKLAAASGRPLRPVGGAASPAKIFGSWDAFVLPLPFARVVVHFGEALIVPPAPSADEVRSLVAEFERRLAAAEKVARDELANW